jgi:hypothetical protein
MVAAGGTLLALPFVAWFVGMVLDEGVLFALVIVGAVALLIGVMVAGAALLEKGLGR